MGIDGRQARERGEGGKSRANLPTGTRTRVGIIIMRGGEKPSWVLW